jgi:DNA-binding MarR family transcriptional regulator
MIKGAPDRSEQANLSELGERLQLAQSTVTELVRRAEEVGIVQRRMSDHDRRNVYVRVTEEGERRLEECFTTLDSERRRLFEALARVAEEARVTIGGTEAGELPDS